MDNGNGFAPNGGNLGAQELVVANAAILNGCITHLMNTVSAKDAQLALKDAELALLAEVVQTKDAEIQKLVHTIQTKDWEMSELKKSLQTKDEEKGIVESTAAYYRICYEEKKRELEAEQKRRHGRDVYWVRQVSLPAPTTPSPSPLTPSSKSPSSSSFSARRSFKASTVKREYKKVIPFAQQVYTNSLEASSPVGSFVAALGRWGQWDGKDKTIDGIDVKHFLFHEDNNQVIPQMVRKAPKTGTELYRMKHPGIPDGQRDEMYKNMPAFEKMRLGFDVSEEVAESNGKTRDGEGDQGGLGSRRTQDS